MLASKKDGNGFINVREIDRLIAKLLYDIRSYIFNKLRTKGRENSIDRELGGLIIYARDML
jgi:hypothetical protein